MMRKRTETAAKTAEGGMIRHGSKATPLQNVILIVCCAVVIGSMVAYHFTPTINSDTVDGVIWAEASVRSGRLLSRSFIYGYAIPFGAHAFQIPFVAISGVSPQAATWGMLCFFAVFIFVCFLFARSLGLEWQKTLVGMTILILIYRSGYGLTLAHHILHYQLGFVCILGMYAMIFTIIRKEIPQKKHFIGLLFFAVWSGSNGIVTVTLSSLPVIAAIVLISLFHPAKRNRKLLQCFVVSLLGMMIGFGLYKIAMIGVTESDYLSSSSYRLLETKYWIANLREIPRYWLELFMTADSGGQPILSVNGIIAMISFAVSVISAGVTIATVIRIRKLTVQELLALYGTLTVWVVTILQFAFIRGPERRVLYNGLYASFILNAVCFLMHHRLFGSGQKTVLVLGAGVVLAFYAIMFPMQANWKTDTSVTDAIREHGLKYGYASFMNANYNTVISDNEVKIRPVYIEQDKITRCYYNSDISWYEPEENPELKTEEKAFLLVDQEEYRHLVNNQTSENSYLESLLTDQFEVQSESKPEEYIYERTSSYKEKNNRYENTIYHVLVFRTEDLIRLFDNDVFLYKFTDDSNATGCETADGVRRIHAGGISFGPYMEVKAGERVRVTLRGQNLDRVEIHVYSLKEEVSLEPREISGTETEIQFTVSPKEDLSSLEILIKNPENQETADDITLTGERVEIIR